MPAVLTHKSIMLLARERLADIRDRLAGKIARGAAVTDLEHRVKFLAEKAHALMSETAAGEPTIAFPGISNRPLPLGQGVSRFAVMGAMGPDIPAFSGLLLPNQAWVFDTVHKGNPDSDRELVVARTTDFIFTVWEEVSRAIGARTTGTAAEREAAKNRMRAYVLGHLCHVAGDVISHPFINDIEWHQKTRTNEKFTHEGGEGSIDARVARQVLGRGGTREGQDWTVWWPNVDEVPQEFFAAYREAMERTYTAVSDRPSGFGPFQKKLTELGLPTLTADFIKAGYHTYKGAVLRLGYGWGFWHWWGFLVPAVVGLGTMFPLFFALPQAKRLTEENPNPPIGERSYFEALMLPLATTSIIPLLYGSWLSALVGYGAGGLFGPGIVLSALSVAAAVVFFSTLGTSDSDLPWWVRWFIILGIPASQGLYFTAQASILLGKGKKRLGIVALVLGSPLLALAIFVVVILLLSLVTWDRELGVLAGAISGSLWVGFLVLVAWIVLPFKLRDGRIPESPEAFPVDQPHLVRLFDDTSLVSDPRTARPLLRDRFYPSGMRPLLKLWWEGTGNLFLRSRRTHIEVSFTGSGDPVQVVPAVPEPMTARAFGEYLRRTVRDTSGITGGLRTAMVHPEDDDLDWELPPGATFADHGDGAGDAHAHEVEAERWKPLATSESASGYVLSHAPKAAQSVRFGRRGPVPADARAVGEVQGLGSIASLAGTRVNGNADTRFRVFFIAGDTITIAGNRGRVERVISDDALEVRVPFPASVTGGDYFRVLEQRESTEGFTYVSNPAHGVVDGESVMDHAADLAALLCMGATTRLLPAAELDVASLHGKTAVGGGAVSPAVSAVDRVFRNWCLDRRRVNEWRMLIGGGALKEKELAADFAPPVGAPAEPVLSGDRVSRDFGWVPLLRQWLDMATRTGQDGVAGTPAPARRGEASNAELSRAMAFLFNMNDPVRLA